MDASEPPPAMLALEADDEIEIAMLLDAALEQAAIDANGDGAIAPPSLAPAEVETAPAPAMAMAKADEAEEAELPMVADARPVTVTVSEKTFAEPPAPIHQVREGESLWSISQYYHVPVEQIRRANKLDAKATVHAGQVLQLVP
jgi:LysM repeat protein